MNELGSIFGQLATMVSQQTEMIERIDAKYGSTISGGRGYR